MRGNNFTGFWVNARTGDRDFMLGNVCVCACVCGLQWSRPLLDNKQVIHYSKRAPSLFAHRPSSPPHQLFVSCVVVKTSPDKQINPAPSNLIDHRRRSRGTLDACSRNTSCQWVVSLFSPALLWSVSSSGSASRRCFCSAQTLSHFTVNWISWTLISLCCNWVCGWDVFLSSNLISDQCCARVAH